jgi:hypothetical protein
VSLFGTVCIVQSVVARVLVVLTYVQFRSRWFISVSDFPCFPTCPPRPRTKQKCNDSEASSVSLARMHSCPAIPSLSLTVLPCPARPRSYLSTRMLYSVLCTNAFYRHSDSLYVTQTSVFSSMKAAPARSIITFVIRVRCLEARFFDYLALSDVNIK